jgi:hypothetical protein
MKRMIHTDAVVANTIRASVDSMMLEMVRDAQRRSRRNRFGG